MREVPTCPPFRYCRTAGFCVLGQGQRRPAWRWTPDCGQFADAAVATIRLKLKLEARVRTSGSRVDAEGARRPGAP
jgi:hypothetical protein